MGPLHSTPTQALDPAALRASTRHLLTDIATAAEGWTVAICSEDLLLRASGALLLDCCSLVAGSIGELLIQLEATAGPLLVVCGDDCADGGADALIEQLRSALGAARCRFVVVLADSVAPERLQRIWSSGAEALCCLQACGQGQLLHALLMVLRGQSCLDPLLRQRLQQPLALRGADGQALELSSREQELIAAVARGHNSREIAALHQLRGDTVRRYLSNLYRKVGVRDQRGLISWSLAHGLIRLPDLHSHPRPLQLGAEGSRHRSLGADRSTGWPAAARPG
ncbi:response regulator transcription factor [Vulcanococcus limneticus Candia 3F8]|nr:response regulator transcription factor [Vulcanococcus limneticus MW73D5]MCP9895474.1 response regulator transcription factor [Vulcanococcus limneticus Candia 3F8]MCP9898828.1 response regulator transcription factor [Vulcanococcus limneticus Candia 3B3]